MTLRNIDLGPWPHPPWTSHLFHASGHPTMVTFHHRPSTTTTSHYGPSIMMPSTYDTVHHDHLPPWTFHLGSCLRTIHHGHLPSYTMMSTSTVEFDLHTR
jgi:hypothetical protein